jgi:hypothetical protein
MPIFRKVKDGDANTHSAGLRRFAPDTFSKLGIFPHVIAARRHHAKQPHAEFATCLLIAFSVCCFLNIMCEQIVCITHDFYTKPSRRIAESS